MTVESINEEKVLFVNENASTAGISDK